MTRVTIYGINNKDKPADARAFLEKLGNRYKKIGADPKGRVSIDWGVQAYPETFVVDREGRIRYKHIGPITGEDMQKTILPLLKELETKG